MFKLGKIIGGFSVVMMASGSALAGVKYSCSFSDGDIKFDLALTRVASSEEPYFENVARISTETDAVNTGNYSVARIGGQVRLTGYTKYEIQTTGDLGELNLSLVGKNSNFWGHGTLNEETIFGDCIATSQE